MRQLPGDHIPENKFVHSGGILGSIPLACADDGIGRLAGRIHDCLNVLFVHTRVNDRPLHLFSLARNRLRKTLFPSDVVRAAGGPVGKAFQRLRPTVRIIDVQRYVRVRKKRPVIFSRG